MVNKSQSPASLVPSWVKKLSLTMDSTKVKKLSLKIGKVSNTTGQEAVIEDREGVQHDLAGPNKLTT